MNDDGARLPSWTSAEPKEGTTDNKGWFTAKRIGFLAITLWVMAFLCAGVCFASYSGYMNDLLTKGGKSESELAAIEDALAADGYDDVFYMLLLGSDTRAGSVTGFGRSDANIVARVDAKNKQITLLSIPRDTKVQIPGHGTQKFNAAYAFEGASGAIRAAEALLGIEISHYAEVSFSDLAGLVDAVGGITVENESRIDNPKCDDGTGMHYVIEAGTQTLDGGQALTFARNRDYPDGDFRRQEHQRQVVEAIASKVMSAPVISLPSILEAAVRCVTTDLSFTELIDLARLFASGDEEVTIYSCMVPSFTKTIDGISYVIVDDAQLAAMLEVFKQGGDPGDYKAAMTAADYVAEPEKASEAPLIDAGEMAAYGEASGWVEEPDPGDDLPEAPPLPDVVQTEEPPCCEGPDANPDGPSSEVEDDAASEDDEPSGELGSFQPMTMQQK